jgi:hypothetical protein
MLLRSSFFPFSLSHAKFLPSLLGEGSASMCVSLFLSLSFVFLPVTRGRALVRRKPSAKAEAKCEKAVDEIRAS